MFKIGAAFILAITFVMANTAVAKKCNSWMQLFQGDLKGFNSKQELFKDYSRQLNGEAQRVYTLAETTYIRKRLGISDNMKDPAVGIQYRKEIQFVKLAITEKLERFYEGMIPANLDIQAALVQATQQMKLLFGDKIEMARVAYRPTLIFFLSDEQVHLNSKKFKVTEAMATDIYLLEALQKRLQNLDTNQRGIISRGAENYETQRIALKTAVENHDFDALRTITGQNTWGNEQVYEESKRRLTALADWPFDRYAHEIKIILDRETQIANANGWQIDFLSANPTPRQIQRGANAFGFKASVPTCCYAGCAASCPYDIGFAPKEKLKWSIRKELMSWSSEKPPESLQFFQIKKELTRWISPSDMVRPLSNWASVWWFIKTEK
jgi:hypothetical protein